MAGLQLSGLASGLDWKSLVDSLMELERAPAARLEREKITNNSRLGVLNTLGTRLSDLKAAAAALNADGIFDGRSASFANSGSTWSASAAAGAVVGTHSFTVTQLASAASLTGASDIGRALAESADVSGLTLSTLGTGAAVTAGEFTINGARVTVDLTESLQDLFDRISTATGGAVTASYDPAGDQVLLSSASPIMLGAANDTSNFLSVARLHNNGTGTITSSSALGAANTAAPLNEARLRTAVTAVDGDGVGTFSINGVEISYDVDADSLSAVIARINASSAGVTASFDRTTDRLVLANKATGDLGITVSESAGGLLGALGLTSGTTFNGGQNAEYSVNGGATLISTSNTFTAESHGITGLAVTATSESTETVTVAANTSAMKEKIDAFISKFNAVQTYIDEQTRITSTNGSVSAAPLSSNREVQAWAQAFRAAAFQAVEGLDGTIQRLEHLGIDFVAGTSTLQVKDTAKLDAALANNPADVEAFFRTASAGFAARFDSLFTSFTGADGAGGLLKSQKDNLTKSNTSIDRQIADIERRLESRRAQMEAAFIAMEQAQSKLQQMQTQLTNAFFKNSSSSSSSS